jgi:hypothetical protein
MRESITLEFAIIFFQQAVIRNVMDQADLGIVSITRSSAHSVFVRV